MARALVVFRRGTWTGEWSWLSPAERARVREAVEADLVTRIDALSVEEVAELWGSELHVEDPVLIGVDPRVIRYSPQYATEGIEDPRVVVSLVGLGFRL